MSPEGEVEMEWGRYDAVRDLGFAALGGNLVSLDAVVSGLMGMDPGKVSYLGLGEKVFRRYDRSPVDEAKAASSEWIPARGKGFV